MSSRNGTIILTFHDTIIYESDMDLLEGPHWLNDTIIAFYVQYLEEEVYKNEKNVCFIRPEITQCLKLSPTSEFPLFLDPLNFNSKSYAVMPLNDNDSATLPGGSHWSLLIFSRKEHTFYHLDSSVGCNHSAAQLLSGKLAEYLRLREHWNFRTVSSLQQTNSYDCGVFVICNLDNVLQYITSSQSNDLSNLDFVSPSHVAKKRSDIIQLILQLKSDSN